MARNEFLTLKTRVLNELHDSSLSSKVGDFVNESVHEINDRTNHKFLQSTGTLVTVASTQEYTISSAINANVDKILSVTSRDPEINLDEMSKQSIEAMDPDFTDEATDPWVYYVFGSVIGLYPTPSAIKTLYIDYIKKAVDLSGDTDTPDIPLQYTQVIVDRAVYRGLKYLRPGNTGVWQAQFQVSEAGIARMIAENQSKPNIKYRMQPGYGNSTEIFVPRPPRIIV